MKKSLAFSIISIIGAQSLVLAQNFAGKKEVLSISSPEKSLRDKEDLVYNIEWLRIPIGIIRLNLSGIEKIEGYECYNITAKARPNNFFSKFYDVEYTVHTYVDKKSFYTRRFEKTRRVKNKTTKTIINFDWEKQRADVKDEGDAPGVIISPVREKVGAKKATTAEVLTGTHDLFSSLYYLRLLDLKANNSYAINIYYGKKNWPLSVKIGEPFLKEIRKKGSFVVFKAVMDSELSEFILGKSKMTVYFTADSRRIPIEFKFGTGIGSVQGKIKSIPKQ